MLNLANHSTAQLFSIPAEDWTAINQRVGEVLYVKNIQAYITQYLPGYAALLNSSQVWKDNTFNGLVSEATNIANYAATAITNFNRLNEQVKQINGNTVPDDLKNETIRLLNDLASSTTPIAAASTNLSNQVHTFLTDNQVIDGQMAKNKDRLGIFWEPLGAIINALEDAAGQVTGTWQAIATDLNNAITSPIEVTMPFIQSLSINAALVSWQKLQEEASAFPSMAQNQTKYWTQPNG